MQNDPNPSNGSAKENGYVKRLKELSCGSDLQSSNPVVDLYREKLIEYLSHIKTMVVKGLEARKAELFKQICKGVPDPSIITWMEYEKKKILDIYFSEIEKWLSLGLSTLDQQKDLQIK